ncbi:hypothetical protein [Nocardia sp. NPDC057353]|uniref:hypothetical protein n=1 Tax=Nocardia sp. NPDC057353 TaxID=3346104 RepID=UPI00364372D0
MLIRGARAGDMPAIAFYERNGGTRTDTRTAHFEQGFDLPEFEYSRPAGFRLR